jgi:hypothetical protein
MVQRRWLHLVLCTVSTLSSGTLACQSSSKCGSGGVQPAEGAVTDFHMQPAVYDGFEVRAPEICTALRTVLVVKGLGTETFWVSSEPCRNPGGLDASGPDTCGPTLYGVLEEARHRLGADGAYTAEVGRSVSQPACDSGQVLPSRYLHIDRWQEADAAVSYLGEALRVRNVGESASVIVEPAVVNCPS